VRKKVLLFSLPSRQDDDLVFPLYWPLSFARFLSFLGDERKKWLLTSSFGAPLFELRSSLTRFSSAPAFLFVPASSPPTRAWSFLRSDLLFFNGRR